MCQLTVPSAVCQVDIGRQFASNTIWEIPPFIAYRREDGCETH
jgi:hypothetical protein